MPPNPSQPSGAGSAPGAQQVNGVDVEDVVATPVSPRPRAGTLLPLSWWHEPRWQLGSSARDLLLNLLSWSADHLRDGRIPESTIRMLAAMTDAPDQAIERLVDGGILAVDGTGAGTIPADIIMVFNLSSAEVATRRAAKVEAGRRGGLATAAKNVAVHDPLTGQLMGTAPKPPKQATEADPDPPPKQTAAPASGATEADRTPAPGFPDTGERSTKTLSPRPLSRPRRRRARHRDPDPNMTVMTPALTVVPDFDRSGGETTEIPDDETRLFSFIARQGAAIRPDSPLGLRLIGLIDRRGIDVVMRLAEAMATDGKLSDRQWALGLENALEKIPDGRQAEVDEADRKRAERRASEQWTRRVEAFQFTGKWDPAWGDPPARAPANAASR